MAKNKKTESEKTDWRRQAREIADSLAIAFILAMVIRHYVLEVFKIPTKSMQPTLLGSPYTGDKILVNKFAYDFNGPERWDVMVFKYPVDTSRNYIKRVVGLPGDRLRVHSGDVYVNRPSGNGAWHIARKPWRVQKALWRRRLSESDQGRSYWVPRNRGAWDVEGKTFAASPRGEQTEQLVFEREILAYEAREFAESRRPFTRITTADVMVQADVEPHARAELEVEIETAVARGMSRARERWTVRLPRDEGGFGSPVLLRGGREVKVEERQPYHLPDGEQRRLQVCHVDHTVIARVGGEQVLRYPYDGVPDFDSYTAAEQKAGVGIGCSGGRVVLADPAVFTDVYYTNHPNDYAVGAPVSLGADEFFVLGDNSANSNDSRAWGTVPRDYLVGEAFLVLWPLGRMKLVR
jgi:signal peptidase I